MASSACWRCTGRALLQSSTRSRSCSATRLTRPVILPSSSSSSSTTPVDTRSFHTTPAGQKGGNMRKPAVNKPLNLKAKKKTVTSAKKPEPGYRRAIRKAIVLSNSNAPNLELPELTSEVLVDTESVGKVFAINMEDLEKMRALETFQKRQGWQFFYRPTTFIRNESVGIARAMESVERYTGEATEKATSDGSTAATATKDAKAISEASDIVYEAEPAIAGGETAEADLAAAETKASMTISTLEAGLTAVKEEIAGIESNLEELFSSENADSKANGKAITQLLRRKEHLEGVIRRVTPVINYHVNQEERKVRRALNKKEPPQTLEDFEALIAQEEKRQQKLKIKREEWAKIKKEAQDKVSRQSANYIITGGSGTGKSILLFQTILNAIRHKWIVMTLPNAHDIVIGTTAYEINPETGRYVQRDYLAKLLSRIGRANAPILAGYKIPEAVHFSGIDVAAGSPLTAIVNHGSAGPEYSYEAFMALLAELEKPGAPPVLFTMDNLDYVTRKGTAYKDPEYKDVHPADLDIVHTFFEYLSGRRKFARQMVVAATTSEIYPNPSLYETLEGKSLPGIGKYDHRIPTSIGKLAKTITLRGLSREHTKLLLQFYKSAGLWDYSWERSVPTNLALEGAGITEEDYKRVKGMFDWDTASLPPVEESAEGSDAEGGDSADTSLADVQKALVIGEVAKEEGRAFEVQRMIEVFKAKPLTEHEIAEKHILTGGVPRQVMKLCLRVKGSLNM
ncbi:37S ribosomal protein S23 mitochondrial [Orbilia oligospora]|uniref:Small ribosomal subunit protein mS29 n=1 Tax=Orbilia oligospora TaxID=2813651 RepID=A0A8H2E5J3_ORBOL|nr:37S ribosomal protein S23 mitochondrial [Orbilia oligospora]